MVAVLEAPDVAEGGEKAEGDDAVRAGTRHQQLAAIACVFSGLPTAIAPTNGRRISATGQAFVVDSRAMRSVRFSFAGGNG